MPVENSVCENILCLCRILKIRFRVGYRIDRLILLSNVCKLPRIMRFYIISLARINKLEFFQPLSS